MEQQIIGFERQLESQKQQYALIGEEIVGVKTLYEKGLAKKPRLLALQRNQADLSGKQGELKAQIARAQEAIGETQLRIIGLEAERKEEISAELAEVRTNRLQLEEVLKDSQYRLSRVGIVAPIAGTVFGLDFNTTGGVIKPG